MIKSHTSRIGRVAAVVFAMSLALAACAGGDAGKAEEVTLRFAWWGSEVRHEATNEALDAFEAEYPNITVERDFGGYEGYVDRILTQFAGGNPPDVFQSFSDVLREFEERDQLLDLGTVSEQLDTSSWSEEVLAGTTVDGSLVALSFGTNTQAMIYNADQLAEFGVTPPEEPWAWEDLAETADEISAASDGSVSGVTDLSVSFNMFEVWAQQRGAGFLDADGLAFEAEELASYWQFWDELRDSGGATPPDVTAESPLTSSETLVSGRAAMAFIFSNQYESVSASAPGSIGMLRFPGEDETAGQYLRSAMALSVAGASEQPAEAAILIDYLLNSPEAAGILGTERGVPANPEMVEPATAAADEAGQPALDLVEVVREDSADTPVPPPPGTSEVHALFVDIAQQVAFEQISIDEGVEAFMSQADAIVAD